MERPVAIARHGRMRRAPFLFVFERCKSVPEVTVVIGIVGIASNRPADKFHRHVKDMAAAKSYLGGHLHRPVI